GPVMAGGRLWLTSSNGELAAYSAEHGSPLYRKEIADSFFLPPIIAKSVMYLLSDNGELIALK
ncbi:MAG: pyrrolo-quinoline quinone, partial [Bdellovibrionales bacterium]